MIARPRNSTAQVPAASFARPGRVRRASGGDKWLSMLHGRFFERPGSTSRPCTGPSREFRQDHARRREDPRFFATGVSVIRRIRTGPPRPRHATCSARYIVTTKAWFGGGADLTPVLDYQRKPDFYDAVRFHDALAAACERHDPSWYPEMQTWCRQYFLPHRNEPRGVGGRVL